MKSHLNCLLFSKHQPIKPKGTEAKSVKTEVDDDQLSNINSEDLGMLLMIDKFKNVFFIKQNDLKLGTDDLWSDMETIIEEHPIIAKNKKRLNEFDSETDLTVSDDKVFKKPK